MKGRSGYSAYECWTAEFGNMVIGDIPTSTILVAEIGEAPNIGKVNGEADDGEQEVEVAPPSLSLGRLS